MDPPLTHDLFSITVHDTKGHHKRFLIPARKPIVRLQTMIFTYLFIKDGTRLFQPAVRFMYAASITQLYLLRTP
jgi:hypothetical protein